MSEQKMREEFEVWAATHYALMELSTSFEDGEYVEPEMQYALEAWQASREALVIELPDDAYLNRESVFVQGYFEGVRLTKEAIKAAGVKVRP